MIYITGDTHIPTDISKLNSKKFPVQKELTKNDYLIICGDFGGLWDNSNEEKYWIKWLSHKNFTTLFIDGNHENFNMLSQLPCVDFCGGKAHMVANDIYHLMRGEIYTIDNKKIFTLGGANSHDKDYRKEGINWWKEELPNDTELTYAKDNLANHDYNVDYVITHCAPSSIHSEISNYPKDNLTEFLEFVNSKLNFKKWFFGHYHIDKDITDKHTCIFDKLINI